MRSLMLLLLFFISSSLGQQQANALIDEDSPYLQQHAYNPVQWMPWDDEAFERARREHKPIFLSIGYSTCHWCHVMAHESFENDQIAELINRYYIPIKVDREEMPHLDSYYQQLFLKVKHRSGGWPLTVLLTEKREAFYIATYIPPKAVYGVEGLDTLLPKTGKRYRQKPDTIARQAAAMKRIMQAKETPKQADEGKVNSNTLFASLEKMYDDIYIGFSIAPKFPEASKIALLFDLGRLGNKKADVMALDILRMMALRGLYDHIDGGFFRYATDAAWEIPHFEKMLYNQAELIPLYVKAYLMIKEPLFRDVVEETIAMTEERFGKKELFFSASDADSDHEEGGYFIYTTDEVKRAISNSNYPDELGASLELSKKGNFEGKVHLNFFSNARPKGFKEFRSELKKLRVTRHYPFIDTKIITAWNAMMIEALYAASKIDPDYVKMADRHLDALLEKMYQHSSLYHQVLFGKQPSQDGLLEDYAFMISALIAGYETTYDEQRLALAKKLLDSAIKLFHMDSSWIQNSDGMPVPVELRDKYYTSSFGRMMQNLYKMAALESTPKYAQIATHSLEQMMVALENRQGDAPSTAIACLMDYYGVVVLKQSKEVLLRDAKKIEAIKHPYVYSKIDDSGLYLACNIGACFAYSKAFGDVKNSIEASVKSLK